MTYFSNAAVFLIQTVFGLYILAIMLRFILQLVRADFYNPLSQFIVKITNPPLKPLRRVIPGLAGIDLSSVLLMLILQGIEIILVGLVRNFPAPDPAGLILFALVQLISLTLYVFIFAIFILAILSWINPGSYNPVSHLLYQITEPVLRPVRRFISPISGLDLSPLVALIGLWLLKLLLLDPLYQWSFTLTYS